MELEIIRNKASSLKSHGLSIEDRKVLKEDRRLVFSWTEETSNDRETSVTKWRRTRARTAYRTIQDANEHLFLAVILSITPTQCAQKKFDKVLEQLIRLNYEEFYFTLDPETKSFLETIAAEQGFAGNRRYLAFMKSLFPRIEPRRIQFAYSLVRRDDIPSFLEKMMEGIVSSQEWAKEESQGGNTTGCLTIIIPTNEHEDGSCNIRVNRKLLMQTIHDFRMTSLKLE
ncbi:hypothetical protein AnigIFM60653_002359 [Aspergillus niger]|nr:uncharacterized protein BO96DRAFT_401834 [Aspergillus niger CBS 101883]GJP97035.1 uncharacterized protein AlacWU_09934 [Aspergillus niger]PYH52391.1 hypothetical protein BO96DRAFT_401834 [Aspergillus niger CBS 101883]GKZ75228.1 hypothetical protein AnigIFM50267_003334 [Aspergillus niger]GLA10264.1 hypothetical protein AnigIFM60653_002359 [Aspergillus niger]GLA44508.1 hypothetical protein AnigIFM63309_003581 [Aspergillus niger]